MVGGGEGGAGDPAAEAEQDRFADGLALRDLRGEIGAAREAGCRFELLWGGAGTGCAKVGGRVAVGAEELGEEGEDDDVDGGVLAES